VNIHIFLLKTIFYLFNLVPGFLPPLLAKCVWSQADLILAGDICFLSSKNPRNTPPSTDGFSFVVVIIRGDMPYPLPHLQLLLQMRSF
jgi:hypothetical protein